ncbi:MAG: F0F1 ATP synthase subunit delta, partial [Acetobacteraceae bacterium]|nr:F0F1 ATP synthase subunit delta [Acetobacteraceae bacterium]
MASAETIAAFSSSPNTTGLAGRYAQALLALADDRRQADPGATDRIAGDLDRLFALWRDDADFRAFVADPRLDAQAQRRGAFGILERVGV